MNQPVKIPPNDDTGHERQETVTDDARDFPERHGFGFLVAPFPGDEIGGDHQRDQHDEGRNHARHEQGGDGHAAGRHGVDDHVVAGRHHDALDGRSRSERHGEVGVVVFLFHHRDHDGPDGGRVGGRRTRNVAEQETRHAVDHGQAAADHADKELGQIDQPYGETAFTHDMAGQNEEGNGQQREGVQPLDHLLTDGGQRQVHHRCGDNRGCGQHERDRKAQQEQTDKRDAQQDQGQHCRAHSGSSSSVSLWRTVLMPISWRKP